MGTIAQELPYIWQPSRAEANRVCWTLLAAFNDAHYADNPHFQAAQAELEEWQRGSGVRLEVQICGFYFYAFDGVGGSTGNIVRLPNDTFVRFRSEEDAAHFKLRWL